MFKKIIALCLVLLTLVSCAKVQPENNSGNLKVVSLAPAITQIIIDLDADIDFVAVDNNSSKEPTLPKNISVVDMIEPDIEVLMSLKPDIIFISNLNVYSDDQKFKPLENIGAKIILIDDAKSFSDIKAQIGQIGESLNKKENADNLVKEMDDRINSVAEKASSIKDKKRILFEISPLPDIYSFGSGVFLNEVIETIGAENVFADQSGWISVTEESAITAYPDVIFTNAMGVDQPVDKILSRKGWEQVPAIINKEIYLIDPDLSSQPNHRIAIVVEEMFNLTYPEYSGGKQ